MNMLHTLTDFETETDANGLPAPKFLDVSVAISATQIQVSCQDGRIIWLEYNDGCLKAHCYVPDIDAPISVHLTPEGRSRVLHRDHTDEGGQIDWE